MKGWVFDFPCERDNNKRVTLEKNSDFTTYHGEIFIDDYLFDGDCERPIWLVKIDGVSQLEYFTSFDEWERQDITNE